MDDKSKHLGLNATQSWCLLRNTPLIFGDVIERDNSHWNFLLLLIDSQYSVLPHYNWWDETLDLWSSYLKHLICDHHTQFQALFPDKKLIPKHHLMIHYPRCIRKIGPLIHIWCMWFEAKHNFFKMFKSLTKSFAKQHQRQLAFHYDNYCFKRFEFGPTTIKTICKLGRWGNTSTDITFWGIFKCFKYQLRQKWWYCVPGWFVQMHWLHPWPSGVQKDLWYHNTQSACFHNSL